MQVRQGERNVDRCEDALQHLEGAVVDGVVRRELCAMSRLLQQLELRQPAATLQHKGRRRQLEVVTFGSQCGGQLEMRLARPEAQ